MHLLVLCRHSNSSQRHMTLKCAQTHATFLLLLLWWNKYRLHTETDAFAPTEIVVLFFDVSRSLFIEWKFAYVSVQVSRWSTRDRSRLCRKNFLRVRRGSSGPESSSLLLNNIRRRERLFYFFTSLVISFQKRIFSFRKDHHDALIWIFSFFESLCYTSVATKILYTPGWLSETAQESEGEVGQLSVQYYCS